MTDAPPLSIENFNEWFRALNDGHDPYQWQYDLAERVITTGRWPQSLVAPTGSGKSSVVEIHIFAVAVSIANPSGTRPPVRLCHVVGRRALVDDTYSRATRIGALLRESLVHGNGGEGILRRVAELLQGLIPGVGRRDDPVKVWSLRGGVVPERGWQDDVTSCQIICATPDMLGSRLLFRGYGSTVGMRPREAGLLAYDATLIVDEAHLNRQLLHTARNVADMASQSPIAGYIPVMQVVESTATPSDSVDIDDSLGIAIEDIRSGAVGDELGKRLNRPKTVQLHREGVWLPGAAGPKKSTTVGKVADMVIAHVEAGHTPVGVVLNRVTSALDLHTELVKRFSKQKRSKARVDLLVGPRRRWEQWHQASESAATEPEVYVATQTIEVGVNLDFGSLITDLAPGGALAQRAGRLNRTGRRPSAPMDVLCPNDMEKLGEKDSAPYSPQDLRAAVQWLYVLAESPDGISPAAILASPPPPEQGKRLSLSELEAARAELLSMTSEKLVVEPDLTFWLRDSLESDREVSVIGRRLPRLGEETDELDSAECISLLNSVPPRPHETYPATIRAVMGLLSRERDAEVKGFVRRSDGWKPITAERVQPGDVICFDHETLGATSGVLTTVGNDAIGDVLDPTAEGYDTRNGMQELLDHREVVFSTGVKRTDVDDSHRTSLLEVCGDLLQLGDAASVRDVFARLVDRGQDEWFSNYLGMDFSSQSASNTAVEIDMGGLSAGEPGQVAWVLFRLSTTPNASDETLSEVSPGSPVLLSDHQRDVGARAVELARRLDLPDGWVELLKRAGLHHDDGKSDTRFQAWLRSGDHATGDLLAKSGRRHLIYRKNRFLPQRWRHEQLSVAIAMAEEPTLEAMTLRLIGTSHGFGRGAFNMNASDLIDQSASASVTAVARELFDTGLWDSLIVQTNREWGAWGASWMEAVLRSADVTISQEGR